MQCAEELEVFLCFLQYRHYGALRELIMFKHKMCFYMTVIMVLQCWGTQKSRFLAESYKNIKHVTFGFERN